MAKRKIVEYVRAGASPFALWFSALSPEVAAKITVALYRLEQGNVSHVKSVGQGVSEYKIDFGPGYRIYFGQEGSEVVILLGGGSKKSQQKDIRAAHLLWAEYKAERAKRK